MLITLSSLINKYNLKISGAIHVGGHHGEEISEYIANNIKNIIIFEPLRSNFKVLNKTIESFSLDIISHRVALGAAPGTGVMYVSNNSALSSSLLKPKKVCEQYTDMLFSQREVVNIATLDSFNLSGYNFLNMDVQGFELEVLKGGTDTLKQIEYIYTEVNRDILYEGTVIINELDSYLKDFDRVETDWSGDTWGDALYIRKRC